MGQDTFPPPDIVTYTAVYVPKLDGDKTKSGFVSRQAAEEYITGFLCSPCQDDLDLESLDVESPEGVKHKLRRTNIQHTSCGAEWFVVMDEEWREYISTRDFAFLLKVAGYQKVSNEWQKPFGPPPLPGPVYPVSNPPDLYVPVLVHHEKKGWTDGMLRDDGPVGWCHKWAEAKRGGDERRGITHWMPMLPSP